VKEHCQSNEIWQSLPGLSPQFRANKACATTARRREAIGIRFIPNPLSSDKHLAKDWPLVVVRNLSRQCQLDPKKQPEREHVALPETEPIFIKHEIN